MVGVETRTDSKNVSTSKALPFGGVFLWVLHDNGAMKSRPQGGGAGPETLARLGNREKGGRSLDGDLAPTSSTVLLNRGGFLFGKRFLDCLGSGFTRACFARRGR